MPDTIGDIVLRMARQHLAAVPIEIEAVDGVEEPTRRLAPEQGGARGGLVRTNAECGVRNSESPKSKASKGSKRRKGTRAKARRQGAEETRRKFSPPWQGGAGEGRVN